MRQFFLTMLVTVALVIPTWAQSKDERDFQKAVSAGTVAALNDFVHKHPKSAFRTEASEKMAEIELKDAASAGTAGAYRAVYEKYESTRAGKEAGARAEELGFAEAGKLDTPVAYARFIRQNPDSAHVVDALKKGHGEFRPRAEAETAFFNALESAVNQGSMAISQMGAGSSFLSKYGDLEVRLCGPATLEWASANGAHKMVKGSYAKGSYFTQGEDLFWYDSADWWILRSH